MSWHEYHDPDAALVPAFDRWGNLTAPIGDTTTGLSTRGVSAIVHTHLRAAGRPMTNRGQWTAGVLERHTRPAAPEQDAAPVAAPELDDVYDAGVGARARAATELANLDDLFDALDDQMAALLERTEALLDQNGAQ